MYCCMFNGKALTDGLRDTLWRVACVMIRNQRKEQVFRHDDGEGVVLTEFDTALIGTVGGPVFQAQLDTPKGKTVTTFIVTDADIRAGMDAPWWRYDEEDQVWVDGHGNWSPN